MLDILSIYTVYGSKLYSQNKQKYLHYFSSFLYITIQFSAYSRLFV